jgi:fucose permease
MMALNSNPVRLKDTIIITLGSFLFTAGFGFWGTILGLLLPDVRSDFNLTYSETGFAFLFGVIPSIVANFIAGMLFRSLPRKLLLIIVAVITVTSIVLQTMSQLYIVYLGLMVLLRFSISIYNVGSSTMMTEAWTNRDFSKLDRYISLLHVLYAAGCIVAALLSGFFITLVLPEVKVSLFSAVGWRFSYLSTLILLGLPLVLFLSVRLPSEKKNKDDHVKKMLAVLLHPVIVLMMVAMTLYVGAEVSIGVWIVTFCESALGYNKEVAAFYLFIYFVLLMIGRLAGARLMSKTNRYKIVVPAMLFAVFITTVALLLKNPLLYAITGLPFSIMFPAIHARTLELFPEESGLVNSILYLFSTLGSTLLPFLIGMANDISGVEWGLGWTLIYLVPILPVLFLAEKVVNINQALR